MWTCNVCTTNLFLIYLLWTWHSYRWFTIVGFAQACTNNYLTYHTRSTKQIYIYAYVPCMVTLNIPVNLPLQDSCSGTLQTPKQPKSMIIQCTNIATNVTEQYMLNKLYSIQHYIHYKDDINGSSSYAAVSLQQSATDVHYIRVFQ